MRKDSTLQKMEEHYWWKLENCPYLIKVRTPAGTVGEIRVNEDALLSLGDKGVQIIKARYLPVKRYDQKRWDRMVQTAKRGITPRKG